MTQVITQSMIDAAKEAIVVMKEAEGPIGAGSAKDK